MVKKVPSCRCDSDQGSRFPLPTITRPEAVCYSLLGYLLHVVSTSTMCAVRTFLQGPQTHIYFSKSSCKVGHNLEGGKPKPAGELTLNISKSLAWALCLNIEVE